MNVAWQFTAKDQQGKLVKDVIGAESEAEAYRVLKEEGYTPIELRERGSVFNVVQALTRRPMERLAFFRSFAALYKAGISMEEAFEILIQQASLVLMRDTRARIPFIGKSLIAGKEKFFRNLTSLRKEVVDSGVPLHEAMARRPNEFSEIEAAMCEVGRSTGDMPEVLNMIATYLERERKVSRQIVDALFYPVLVAITSIALVIYMVVRVIPQFADLYKNFNVDLPPIMFWLLTISHILTNPLFFIPAFIASIALLCLAARAIATPEGAYKFDRFRMSIPLLGTFFQKIVLVRMCRTLGMLFRSGKGAVEALQIAAPVVGSPVYDRRITEVRTLLGDGRVANFYEAMMRSEAFDPFLVGYIKVGQQTGEIGPLLDKIADYYEEDIQSIAAVLPNLLQVAITIGLGGVVGLIVSAVYVPLMTLSTSVH